MKKFLLCISLVCMMLISFSSTTLASDWQWITSTDTESYSFDPSKIKEVGKDRYTVWVKLEFKNNASQSIANQYKLSDSIATAVCLLLFDAKENTSEQRRAYAYDKDNQFLGSAYNQEPTVILPGTTLETTFKVTYAEYKKQFNKKPTN